MQESKNTEGFKRLGNSDQRETDTVIISWGLLHENLLSNTPAIQTMIEKSNQLYKELLTELEHCRTKADSFLLETEYRFHAAERYRGLLRHALAGYEFPSIEQEVQFFKTIKPKFIAESEYASLLNFAASFCPNAGPAAEIPEFWKRQMLRLEKFKREHSDFYNYYSSGKTNLDLIYFTRIASDKTRSDYDLLVGQLMARERYARYAQDQLKMEQNK